MDIESKPGTYNRDKLEKTWKIMRRDKYIKAINALKDRTLKKDNDYFFSKIEKSQATTSIKKWKNEYHDHSKLVKNISSNAKRVQPDYSTNSIYYYHVHNLDRFDSILGMNKNSIQIKNRNKSCNEEELISNIGESEKRKNNRDDIYSNTTMTGNLTDIDKTNQFLVKQAKRPGNHDYETLSNNYVDNFAAEGQKNMDEFVNKDRNTVRFAKRANSISRIGGDRQLKINQNSNISLNAKNRPRSALNKTTASGYLNINNNRRVQSGIGGGGVELKKDLINGVNIMNMVDKYGHQFEAFKNPNDRKSKKKDIDFMKSDMDSTFNRAALKQIKKYKLAF